MLPIKLNIILFTAISSLLIGCSNIFVAEQPSGTPGDPLKQIESENCQGSTQLTYHSQKLATPDKQKSVYFEVILKRIGKEGDAFDNGYCFPFDGRQTVNREMVIINKANKSQKKKLPLPSESQAYIIMNPQSFSADGRYLVVVEKYAYDGGDGGTFSYILDTQENYKNLPLVLCKNADFVDYQGFISEQKVVFSCGTLGDRSWWEVVDIAKNSTNKISSQVINAAGKLQSYGTVISPLNIVNKQVISPQ